MPDQIVLNGNILLQTDPPNAAGSLSLSRTDAGATVPMAQISMYGGGTNNLQGILSFRTMSSGNPAGPLEERMRIDTNGNVGIGVPNPGQKLEVAGTVKAAAFQGNGAGLTSVTDATKVAKTGDTMSGTLNLPANGLIVGTNQLLVSGGNVGIGTATPKNRLDVEGGAAIGANYSGTNTAPVNGLLVEGNVGIGVKTPTQKLDVAGNIAVSGTVDGVDISTLKSDVDGRVSRYSQFGNLNYASVNASTAWIKIPTTSGSHTFTKSRSDTKIEVYVHARFSAGVFVGANGVHFQARVDDLAPSIGNDAAIVTNGGVDFLALLSVYSNLPAGPHTVSIWTRTATGVTSGVLVDPGGLGGKIIVKECW